MNSVPHPDDDAKALTKERRATHRRRKRPDTTTKVIRVRRDAHPDDRPVDPDLWPRLANDPPALPDPPLRRNAPPPAPLPSEPLDDDSYPPPLDEHQQNRRRIEEALGVIGLAVLVTAMVIAMWLRMTGGS